MLIQYDERKNQINIRKHHISIPELATIFNNPSTILDIPDEPNSKYEPRYHAFGWTNTGWHVMIWYTYRGENVIRIIGGRKLK